MTQPMDQPVMTQPMDQPVMTQLFVSMIICNLL